MRGGCALEVLFQTEQTPKVLLNSLFVQSLAGMFLCMGLLGCNTDKELRTQPWRSYLVGAPEITCVRDSDCPVGVCALDGCSALTNTLRRATRETMLREMARRKERCSESCRSNLDKELEALFRDASVTNALMVLRLAEALVLHSDSPKARALLRSKSEEATELETVVSLQVVLARMGDEQARRDLALNFPTDDPIVDLLLLSAGIAVDVQSGELCKLQNDMSATPAIRALAMFESCSLGVECPNSEDTGFRLRPLNRCGNPGKM